MLHHSEVIESEKLTSRPPSSAGPNHLRLALDPDGAAMNCNC